MHPFASELTHPGDRGAAYGAHLRGVIGRNLAGYAEFWAAWNLTAAEIAAFAEEVGAAIARWAPETHAELLGVAAGAEVSPAEIFALTGRTELLTRTDALLYPAAATGVGQECSTLAVVRPGVGLSAQTWDWYPHLAVDGVAHEHAGSGAGGRVHCFTEPGMLGKIGVNAAGLGLHLNILAHTSDGVTASGGVGVPVHVVAREILRRATTVAEAIAVAESALADVGLSASTVLTVVTAGEAACLELCPVAVRAVWPERVEAGAAEGGLADSGVAPSGVLWHTNHFRHPDLVPGEALGEERTTWSRGDYLAAHREELSRAQTSADLAAVLCGGAPAGDPAAGDRAAGDGTTAPTWVEADLTLPELDRTQTMLVATTDRVADGPAQLGLVPTPS
ncbi:MAG: C45 family peptidase [Nocardioides sp.]